ncbi:MAG: LCP family protein [Actinomycetota bacterium]|nr:LCP family protein [Actinomycetota bacterium]MDH5224868.1 LCP family protein [Actinomycetota bacterium]MDH5312493.1 LCP family protein [Actinomycetota bacterium]
MRRRAAFVLVALVAWVVGSTLGALNGAVTARAQSSGVVVGKAHAGFTPALTGSKPVVILAIGSGARPGENIERSLGDSLHLIFLNPARRRAVLVGIPRDSYVPIPGRGTGKINSAMVYGGPDLLVQTMEQNFGVTIDYWALTTFWGFTDMINAVGGLTVDVPFPMVDSFARTDFSPGVQKLSGPEALAFSRDRHSLQQGDFGRQENGGRLILAALAQFKKQFRADQARLFTWLGAGMRNIDTEIPLREMMALAFTASKVPPGNVQNVVLPGGTGTIGGISVVTLDMARARAIVGDAKKDGVLFKKNVPPSPTARE